MGRMTWLAVCERLLLHSAWPTVCKFSYSERKLISNVMMIGPSSVEVKNEWSYTSIPPCVFMACTGIILRLLLEHTLTNFSPFNNTVAFLITLLSAIYTYIVTSRVEVSMGFHIVAFWIMKSCQVLVNHTASIFREEELWHPSLSRTMCTNCIKWRHD